LTLLIKVLAESIEKEIVDMGNRRKSKPKEPAANEASVETTDAGNAAEEAKAAKSGASRKRKKTAKDGKNVRGVHGNPAPGAVQRSPQTDRDMETLCRERYREPHEDQAIATETTDAGTGKVSEAIRKIASSATLAEKSTMAKKGTSGVAGNIFEMRAEDIMQKGVTWAGPNESLQQALAKIQQTDSGYVIIGQNGVPEGIVSKSDISRAMSPYLQPIFAKWRRPLDDATLKIRIKWIMSRPVRTVKRETPLVTVMEYMNQFRGRCLVVADEEGNVQGLVTAFAIFQAILNHKPSTFAEDRETQALTESAVPVAAT
jgi:CBS domain-containing protein